MNDLISDEDSLLLNPDVALGSKPQSSNRINYQAQADVIIKQIGDLEQIRKSLGLSARKISQLLLVDPSSWSRWTQKGDSVPPHIYRSLQWFMALQEKVPGLSASYFLQKDTHQIKKEIQLSVQSRLDEIVFNSVKESQRLEDDVRLLKDDLISALNEQKKLKARIKNLFFLLFLACLASCSIFLFT